MGLRAQQVIDLLGLKPHPTCGFVAETFRSQQLIPQAALPAMYEGGRPFASVLYFMVTPEARIRLHRIRSDQMYHHYLGDPLEVLLLHPDGSGAVQMVGLRPGNRSAAATVHPRRHLPRLAVACGRQLFASRDDRVAWSRTAGRRAGRSGSSNSDTPGFQ